MKDIKKEMYKARSVTRLLDLCLLIAEWNDRSVEAQGEHGFDSPLSKDLGYGYLALSGYLRDGVKAVVELQSELSDARSREALAKVAQKSAEDFLEEIFGDREVETLNDAYIERIKKCVAEINAEIDAEIEEEKKKEEISL